MADNPYLVKIKVDGKVVEVQQGTAASMVSGGHAEYVDDTQSKKADK